ncbi:MAG: hypothetical protein COB08_016060 [Rhodobacteraceae bacterium]|nr:hypothetical protein [Paracoccaceae bacterium]
MVAEFWWVEGLFSNELEAAGAPADTALAKAWVSVLSGAQSDAEIDSVSAIIGLETNTLLALCAAPAGARIPRDKTRPAWAAPLPKPDADVQQLPAWKAWSGQSATAYLILPLLAEVYTALAPSFARMAKTSGLETLADGVLEKLLYVLDTNICAAGSASSQSADEFWTSKPAALRHARAVSGAFIATILRFEAALSAAPSYINLQNLTHLFIEPLDLHRGGTSVVMAEGAGVFQPREAVAFELLQHLFATVQREGMLLNWQIPRYLGVATGTWVEWVNGKDLDDMDATELEVLGPDLAAFAVLMWVFGAAGIEPESVMAQQGGDHIYVVQADGLFAPSLGVVDEKAQLKSWLALFFDNEDLPLCPTYTEACKASAMAALEVAQKVAPALLEKAKSAAPVRCFTRPVSAYAQLLRAVPHLNAAGDGLARELVFSRLRDVPENLSGHDVLPIIQEELADLKRYDLPFVTARPKGETLFFDKDRGLTAAVPRCAIAQIEARVELHKVLAEQMVLGFLQAR